MPLCSFVGKFSRTPVLNRVNFRILFARSLLCCLSLAMAGTQTTAVVAQDALVDPVVEPIEFNEIIDLIEPGVLEPIFDDGKMVDTGVVFSDDTAIGDSKADGNEGDTLEGEVTTTEVVVDPEPVDDSQWVIQPYYRSNTPDEDGVVVDDLLLWCGGGIDPFGFFYYCTFPPVFNLSSLAMSAQTPNQIAVATRLDALSGVTTPEIQSVIDDIGLLTPDQQRVAFDSLSGETYGTLSTVGLEIGQQSLRTVSNRLVNNLAFLSGGGSMLLGQRSASPTATSGEQLARGQSPEYGPTGWMQGYGSGGSWSGNGIAAGADYRLGGFSYGADLAGDGTGVFGISGGHGYTTLGTDRGDTGNVTSHQVGLYLLKNFDSFYGLGVFNYGHNNNKLTRVVTIGLVQQLVRSSLSSNQFGTYGEAGLNLDAEVVRFQPFFGLQYLSLTNGSAFEGSGGGVGLNVTGNSTDTLQTHLGARAILQTLRSESGIEFRPYLNARWVADLLGNDRATTASLVGAPAGASWTVTGNHTGRHTGQAGAGFTAQVADGVSLFGNYDLQFGSHYFAQTGSGGVLFEF